MSYMNEFEELKSKLEELEKQVDELKEQRDRLNLEVKKHAEQRDKLNLEHRKILSEIKINKDKRDKINEMVTKLKEHRHKIISQIKKRREELFTLKRSAHNLFSKVPESSTSLKLQIDKLEWEIQTNSLSLTEERNIIEKIKLLEKELSTNKELAQLNERLDNLNNEIDALKEQNNQTHKNISEHANKSQEYHKKMIENMIKIRPLKKKADDAHELYLKQKSTYTEINRKYLKMIKQIQIFNKRLRKAEDAEYNDRLNRQNQKIIEATFNKLKSKRKITLEEFKLLKEKGLV